jgi:pilus assembly protein CpaE
VADDPLTLRLEVADPGTKEELTEIIGSVEGWRLVEPPEPCSLLILETGRDLERDFRRIRQVQVSGEAGEIFLTSKEADPNALIRALREGVGEFFPQPLKRDEVVEALLRLGQRQRGVKEVVTKAEDGKVFSVFGAKGGVGTTTIAVNLATGLAGFEGNPSLALLDLSPLSGEVPLFLNMKPVFSWVDVARNISRLDATYLMSILQRHATGVNILPMPVRMVEEVTIAPEVIEKVLKLMRSLFDFIFIDGGRQRRRRSQYLARTSDKVLVVAIPNLPGVINLKTVIESFLDLGCASEDIVVVVNRYNQKSHFPLDKVHEMINADIHWSIPNDYRNTMSAISSGEPLTTIAPKADVTKKILQLAASLSGRKDDEAKWASGRRGHFLGIF